MKLNAKSGTAKTVDQTWDCESKQGPYLNTQQRQKRDKAK